MQKTVHPRPSPWIRWNSAPMALCAVAFGWGLMGPLIAAPSGAKTPGAAQQESSSAFQPVPAAIETLQDQAKEAYRRGQRQEALALQQEVMAWVKANLPAVHPFRAKAMSNLGIHLSGMGRRAEALPPTLEALKIYRELAKTNSAFLPDLAMALNNLGKAYSDIGRRSDALQPTIEAVKIYRELGNINPDFLADLAGSLNNLGIRYSELGLQVEALPPILEAFKIVRSLAKDNPAYISDLAMSLRNLGIRYADQGQRSQALAPILEAIEIYRKLAKVNPSYLPDLAFTLSNIGSLYGHLGRQSESLGASEEAVVIYRELAKNNPVFSPDLASALNNMADSYRWLGRFDSAAESASEAKQIYSQLSQDFPARFREDLVQTANKEADLRREVLRYDGIQFGTRKKVVPPDDLTFLNLNNPDDRLRRSVVRIFSAFSSGIGHLGLGTGFVVKRQGDRAWIATARHVVLDPRNSALPSKLEAELYSGSLPANLTTARLSVVLPSIADIDASSGEDLILLEVKGLPADIAPLPLASDPPQGALKVVGHPAGSPPWSVQTLPLLKSGTEVLILDGTHGYGSGGSPVLDSTNRVVGVVYGLRWEVGLQNPQIYALATGASMLDIIRSRGILEYTVRKKAIERGFKPIAPDNIKYLPVNDDKAALRRSVVRLWVSFAGKSGAGVEVGTGFVVGRRGNLAWILTTRHILIDPEIKVLPVAIEAELYSGNLPPGLVSSTLAVPIPLDKLNASTAGADLILLEVEGLPPDITPLSLASGQPQSSVTIIGHPTDLEPWSSVPLKLLPDIKSNKGDLMYLYGSLGQGASGSPMFDTTGKVVGLVFRTQHIDGGELLVYAYPSKVIQAMMAPVLRTSDGPIQSN